MKNRCENCYYYETCKGTTPCSDFDPVSDDIMSDEDVIELVDSHRDEYQQAWNTYLHEFYN